MRVETQESQGGMNFKDNDLKIKIQDRRHANNESKKFPKTRLQVSRKFDESFHEEWDRYKNLLRACHHHGFTKLHQLDTFYNALNPADQDSFNAVAGSNMLERRTQDVLTIIKNKYKVHNSRNKSVVSQVKSNDANSNSSSEIAKLTHAVNQQKSAVTTAMTAILKQFQATPPPAFVKAVEEICVTCGGAHLYYQCLAAGGNTFPELRDNIQGYVAAAAVNYNHGNSVYRPPEQSYQAPTQQNQVDPLNELKKVKRMNEANMKAVQTQINNVKNKLRNEIKNSIQASMSNQTNELKNMMASFFQMNTALGSGSLPSNTIANPNGELKAITTQSGASVKLMPLFVWKKLGLPELISTRMTLELANREICTPAGIAKDVFVPVGKFTFPADFVIVDYESVPRVPLILGRPFLRTAHALIDVHGEEMILRDGGERLTLNMRHDTSSYSNQPQKESINLINVFNDSNGGNVLPEKLLDLDSTKDLHPPLHVNPLSGSTTYSSSPTYLFEEFTDKLALITFPSRNDDLQFDIESYLKEIEYLLHHDPIKDIDSCLRDSIDQIESDNVYDDPFDSKGDKIKESKLLIDELDLPCDFLLPFEYDSFLSKDFSKVDDLPSTNNENKLAISNASLMLEDFDPPLSELLILKEVP
nr:reverse transcriptase domain-containing protein [Tanacetum cinerariifolium]